jgi:hypothetical protein
MPITTRSITNYIAVTSYYGAGGKRWIMVDVMVDEGHVSPRDLRIA